MRYILILIVSLFVCFNLQAQSLLIEIKGKDVKGPAYIFGTIHLVKGQSIPIFDSAITRLMKCEKYAMEINPEDLNDIDLGSTLFIPHGKSIKDFLSDDEYKKLATYFNEKTHMNLALFDRLLPCFIESYIESAAGLDTTNIMMDMSLMQLAKQKGISLSGLETVSEQVKALTSISLQEQIESLKQCYQNEADDSMVNLYLDNNREKIFQFVAQQMSKDEMKSMLTSRNARMYKRSRELMKKSSVFIAVGAAHLGGPKGLINRFKKAGYTVVELN